MCQMHFIMRADGKGLDEQDLTELKWITERGGATNNDATGIFSTGFVHKDGIEATKYFEKYWEKIKPDLLGKPFVVSHNRLGSWGPAEDNKNNHPFIAKSQLGNVIVTHNGRLTNDYKLKDEEKIECEGKTDSEIIPKLIAKYIDAGKTPDAAVKKCAELLIGDYSIFALVQKTLYYFKNSQPDFIFGMITFENGKKVIVGSTSEENIDRMYQYSYEGIFDKPAYSDVLWLTPEDEQIYKFENFAATLGETFEEKEWNDWGKNRGKIIGTVDGAYQETIDSCGNYYNCLNGSDSHLAGSSTEQEAMKVIKVELIRKRQGLSLEADNEYHNFNLTYEELSVVKGNLEKIRYEDYESLNKKELIRQLLGCYYTNQAKMSGSIDSVEGWLGAYAEFWLTPEEYAEWQDGDAARSGDIRRTASQRARDAYTAALCGDWSTIREWMTSDEEAEWIKIVSTEPREGDGITSRVENRMISAKKLYLLDCSYCDD